MIADARRRALVLLALFVALSAAGAAGRTLALDQAVAGAVTSHRTPLQNSVAVNATALGSESIVLFFALLVAAYAIASGRPRIVLALTWTVLSLPLDDVLKPLFHRPRPTEAMTALPASHGFPSGHALAASALYITLALIAAAAEQRTGPRRLLIASGVAIALLVAWSRVYIGVHYLSDVVGGLLLGTAGAIVAAGAVRERPLADGQADGEGLEGSGA
jgi:membrane-associated phospholipid phosphatase